MKGQTIKTKIPMLLPNDVVLANKTGELDTVENDVGIVFTPSGDIAIAVLTNNVKDAGKTREAIGKLTNEAYYHVN
jgi:beta-lactamase class A